MILVARVVVAVISLLGSGGGGGVPPLQPATYSSPSEEWILQVDPTERTGPCPADYVMTRSGQHVWSKRLPYTLTDARIDDQGYAAGCADDRVDSGPSPCGLLRIVALAPAGEILVQETWPLEAGRVHYVRNLVSDPQHHAVFFRLLVERDDGTFEEWRRLDLRSGEVHGFRPHERCGLDPERDPDVLDLCPIAGTDLLAACWSVKGDAGSSWADDMLLTVVGPDGRPLASSKFPAEIVEHVGRDDPPTILPGQCAGAFGVWLRRSGVRADFSWTHAPGTTECLLQELSREPYAAPPDPALEDPDAETIELSLLERVELQAGREPALGPICSLKAFGFAGPGRLQAVRLDERQGWVFACLILDEEGNVLLERRLAPLGGDSNTRRNWWPLGKGRWLVAPDRYDEAWSLDAFLIDSSTGESTPNQCAGLNKVVAVSASQDGGYVALGAVFGSGKAIARYDASGARLWLTSLEGVPDDPTNLDSADDVAVSRSGVVAVVDPWKDALGLFGSDGKFIARLKLNELWDHDPIYVAHIEPDGEAGFLVFEDPGTPVVHRIGLDGRIRSSFVPRHPDGSRDRWLAEYLQCAADGSLWTSDRNALLRLDQQGLADRVLGRARIAEALQDPGESIVDPLGRIAIQDEDTRAVHVFDQQGAQLFVAKPLPGDFEGSFSERDVLGSFDGRLLVRSEAFGGAWLGFDEQGQRLGPIDLGGSSRFECDAVAFAPEPGHYWVHGAPQRDVAVLRDTEKRELARTERRSDRRWFEELRRLSTDASGQLAVLEDLPYSGGGSAVSWFDPRGRPLGQRTICRSVQGNVMASSEGWIAVASYNAPTVWLCRKADAHLMRWIPPDAALENWARHLGFSPDGRELWLVQASARALWRFALPLP